MSAESSTARNGARIASGSCRSFARLKSRAWIETCSASRLAGLLVPALFFACTAAMAGTIKDCHDGDTCTVITGATEVKVRLYCIDAPELDQYPWGDRARAALGLSRGDRVTLVRHGTDRYGRVIAEIIRPDGQNAGLELVRAGHAAVYRRYCRTDAYYRAEDEARRVVEGIWLRPGEQQTPWEWRRR